MPLADPKARREYQRRWVRANPARAREYGRRWREKNPGHRRVWQLAQYGLTPDSYDALWIEQLGLCAVCGRPGDLVVDHAHDTGAVRGLLHRICNVAIGMLGDTQVALDRAASYLHATQPAR